MLHNSYVDAHWGSSNEIWYNLKQSCWISVVGNFAKHKLLTFIQNFFQMPSPFNEYGIHSVLAKFVINLTLPMRQMSSHPKFMTSFCRKFEVFFLVTTHPSNVVLETSTFRLLGPIFEFQIWKCIQNIANRDNVTCPWRK